MLRLNNMNTIHVHLNIMRAIWQDRLKNMEYGKGLN